MSSSFPSERGHALLRGACLSTVIWFSLGAANLAHAQDASYDSASQDVAEAARQARARKAAQAKNSAPGEIHVYTNEDLQQAEIVARAGKGSGDPAGNSRVDARAEVRAKQIPAASKRAVTPAASAAVLPDGGPAKSLGEVARRYRQEKAQREAERVSKLPAPSPFHLPVAQPVLAEMVPHASLVAPSPALAKKNATPAASQVARIAANKRDPFSRPSISLPRAFAPAQLPRIANSLAVQAPQVKSSLIKHIDVNAGTAVKAHPAEPSLAAPALPTPAAHKALSVYGTVAPGAKALPSGISRFDCASQIAAAKAVSLPSGTVVIHAGDSLWKLSRHYLGSSTRWPTWMDSNPGLRNPRKLRAGDLLLVPSSTTVAPVAGPTQATQGATQSHPQSILVRPGDSLWKIAAQNYGHGRDWPSIAQANPQLQGSTILHPGRRLTLPPYSPLRAALHVSPVAR